MLNHNKPCLLLLLPNTLSQQGEGSLRLFSFFLFISVFVHLSNAFYLTPSQCGRHCLDSGVQRQEDAWVSDRMGELLADPLSVGSHLLILDKNENPNQKWKYLRPKESNASIFSSPSSSSPSSPFSSPFPSSSSSTLHCTLSSLTLSGMRCWKHKASWNNKLLPAGLYSSYAHTQSKGIWGQLVLSSLTKVSSLLVMECYDLAYPYIMLICTPSASWFSVWQMQSLLGKHTASWWKHLSPAGSSRPSEEFFVLWVISQWICKEKRTPWSI